jgi:hypothetical protein
MKRFLGIILVLILIVALFTGCNVSMGLGSYEYNKVHVDTYHYSGCLEVDKWYDNSTGLEIKTEDGQSMFFSEGTYILIEDECPFCE